MGESMLFLVLLAGCVIYGIDRKPVSYTHLEVYKRQDEGDPGAFMDRSLLEGDPHAIL